MTFLIIRKPVLMEDEGRYETVLCKSTREEAEAWVGAQEDEYFKPTDYYITEVK